MTDLVPTFDELDADGALQETAEAAGISRATLLRRAAFGGGAVLGGGALLGTLAESAVAAPRGAKNDVAILNFALTLEFLEASFYTEAVASGALRGETRVFARTTKAHEVTHVKALRATIPKLGGKPVAKPKFNFKGTTKSQAAFQKTAIVLEGTGVAAYSGQAPLVKLAPVLAAAASILAVEAEHYAWIRNIVGRGNLPAPAAFAPALTKQQVLKAVAATGFIVG